MNLSSVRLGCNHRGLHIPPVPLVVVKQTAASHLLSLRSFHIPAQSECAAKQMVASHLLSPCSSHNPAQSECAATPAAVGCVDPRRMVNPKPSETLQHSTAGSSTG